MIEFNYDFKTSVTIVQKCLIVTFPNDITDKDIELELNRIVAKANSISVLGAIFDLSMLSCLDSYTFELLQKASKVMSLIGVNVVWIGLKPGVVSSLLDLNIDVSCIETALNLEQGFKLILKSQFNKNRGAY